MAWGAIFQVTHCKHPTLFGSALITCLGPTGGLRIYSSTESPGVQSLTSGRVLMPVYVNSLTCSTTDVEIFETSFPFVIVLTGR